jgi:hypothetical protein
MSAGPIARLAGASVTRSCRTGRRKPDGRPRIGRRVALIVAHTTGKRVGLDTATRMRVAVTGRGDRRGIFLILRYRQARCRALERVCRGTLIIEAIESVAAARATRAARKGKPKLRLVTSEEE